MATSSYLLLVFLTIPITTLTSAVSPPFSTTQDHQHADRIIEAMIGAGDFRDWAADFLSAVDDQFGIPLSATIFIPTDFDAADISSSGANPHRLSVGYYIVPQRLSFKDLCLLKPLSRLPTLLPGKSIVVTNNSVSDYTLDGVLVSEPDIFLSSSIAIHGVASPLDFSSYGDSGNGDTDLADILRRRRGHRHHGEDGDTDSGSNTDEDETHSASAPTSDSSASLFTAHFSTKSSFLFPLALLTVKILLMA